MSDENIPNNKNTTMRYHKRTGYPMVDTLQELQEAEKRGYIYVHARCPKCKSYYLSLIPNAKIVLTKGCALCQDDEDFTVGVLP